MLAPLIKILHSGVVRGIPLQVHPPIEDMVEQLFLKGFDFGLIVFELIAKSLIVILIGYTYFFVNILDVSGSDYEN